MIEFVPVIEYNKCVRTIRMEPVVVEGPITLEEHQRELREQLVKERVEQLRSKPVEQVSRDISEWEPSGIPRWTKEEVHAQLLQEIAPNVLFSFSAQKLNSEEYTPLALYQTDRGGRLSSIEIEARRLKQTDRASIRISAEVMGQPAQGLAGELALVDLKNNYQKKLQLSKDGVRTFYKMKSGDYTLAFHPTKSETLPLDEDEELDEVPVLLQRNQTTIYRAPRTNFNLPKVPGVDTIKGSVRAITQAASQTLSWRP